MPVFASQTEMFVIPYRKVGDRKFVHHFPGKTMSVPVCRFLSQVQTLLLARGLFDNIIRFILARLRCHPRWCGS